MGNFDGKGYSLNLKSDKGGEPSSLISRVKHLLAIGARLTNCSRRSSRYEHLMSITILIGRTTSNTVTSVTHVPLWKL